ncbi:MAG TPA: phosphorylated adapter RNA export RNA-binding domain-containing protein [Polyangiaceae bacterium]|nr:phosphorylated adapter RNA export RNA-binding domain-containing protein [Polyangiaceae bacterium]
MVEHLGEQPCLTLLSETEKIEKAGGLMRGDGSGRRSPGGVFFFLARQRLPRDIRAAIFNDKKPREPRPAGAPPPEQKPKSSAAAAPPPPPPSSSGLPRRRVFEVVPASKPAASASPHGTGHGQTQAAAARQEPRGDWPPAPPEGAYIPPELPSAVVRAKAKQTAHEAIASLNPTDQYLILLELVAELHAQFGGEVPRSAAVEVPRSERKPTGLSQPPPEPEEVEEPKPRATRSKAARPKAASAKTRSRG